MMLMWKLFQIFMLVIATIMMSVVFCMCWLDVETFSNFYVGHSDDHDECCFLHVLALVFQYSK